MRLFVATLLSASARRSISRELLEVVDRSRGSLRPVPADSEHLTHVFLGERGEDAAIVLEALEGVRKLEPFPIRLGGVRVFMGAGRPRLVCLDVVDGGDRLVELSGRVRGLVEPLYPDLKDYRVKRPHVTLARFSRRARRKDGREVEALLSARGLDGWQAAEVVTSVELIRSELTPSGARYDELGRVHLAQR